MRTAETLRAARALIEDPAKWSAHGWGSDGQRCASHAIAAAVPADPEWVTETRAWRLVRDVMGTYIGAFNDTHTHAEVLDAFDRAIARAEGA